MLDHILITKDAELINQDWYWAEHGWKSEMIFRCNYLSLPSKIRIAIQAMVLMDVKFGQQTSEAGKKNRRLWTLVSWMANQLQKGILKQIKSHLETKLEPSYFGHILKRILICHGISLQRTISTFHSEVIHKAQTLQGIFVRNLIIQLQKQNSCFRPAVAIYTQRSGFSPPLSDSSLQNSYINSIVMLNGKKSCDINLNGDWGKVRGKSN